MKTESSTAVLQLKYFLLKDAIFLLLILDPFWGKI